MENRSHIIAAVIFIVVLGGGAVGFYFWLTAGKQASRPVMIATQKSVGGVSRGTEVMFKGLRVGLVESVRFDPDNPHIVQITFKIKDFIPLNASSYGELASQGLMGASNLNLYTPDPDAKPLEPQGDGYVHIPLHQGLLGKLKEQGQNDLAKISTILDQIQKLTGDQNLQSVSQILHNVDRATQRLVRMEDALKPVLAKLPRLTAQIDSTAASARQLLKQAAPTVKAARKAMQAVGGASESSEQVMRRVNDHLLPQINALTRQLRETTRQIQTLSTELSVKPQSLLTGPPKRKPGPGEPGFEAPAH